MSINAVLVLHSPTDTAVHIAIDATPYLVAGGGDILIDAALNLGGTGWNISASDLLGENSVSDELRAIIASWDVHLHGQGVADGVRAVAGLVIDSEDMVEWLLTNRWQAAHSLTLVALHRSLLADAGHGTLATDITAQLSHPAHQEAFVKNGLRLDQGEPLPDLADYMVSPIARTVSAIWSGLVAQVDARKESGAHDTLADDVTDSILHDLGVVLYMVGCTAREHVVGFSRAMKYKIGGLDTVTAREIDKRMSSIHDMNIGE